MAGYLLVIPRTNTATLVGANLYRFWVLPGNTTIC